MTRDKLTPRQRAALEFVEASPGRVLEHTKANLVALAAALCIPGDRPQVRAKWVLYVLRDYRFIESIGVSQMEPDRWRVSGGST